MEAFTSSLVGLDTVLRISSEPEDSSRYGEVGTDGKVKEVLMKGRGRDGA